MLFLLCSDERLTKLYERILFSIWCCSKTSGNVTINEVERGIDEPRSKFGESLFCLLRANALGKSMNQSSINQWLNCSADKSSFSFVAVSQLIDGKL